MAETKKTATKTTTKRTCARKTTKAKEEIKVEIVKKKSVLFVASESAPFIATGGLADVIGSLPKALAKETDLDIRVMLPLYADVVKEYKNKLKYLGNFYVPLAWRSQYCGVFSLEYEGVTFYFLDNEYYFKRPGLYGYFDDGERFAYFSRAAIEAMAFLDFYPDVLHCHDWQTALAVVYLKTIYCVRQNYRKIKTVFTIHNIEYQGKYAEDTIEDLFGISRISLPILEFDGCINLMKGAIECTDILSTVSPKYAQEIRDPYYAHGLESIINRNASKLRGVLNGIDVDTYNPEIDELIFKNYTADDLAGKAECKEGLQKMLGLPVRADVPMIAMISRLVSHKGLDLVKRVLEEILQEDVQFVILGQGDSGYERYFQGVEGNYEGKFKALIKFNKDLARKIYSGADLFLMPSKSEPCGLSQMISSRYGTIPIVRETGGLYDSIKPFVGDNGNGFTFANYNAHDMLYVVRQAIRAYKESGFWDSYVQRAMTTDFSWGKSAKQYEEMYNDLLK